MKAYNIMILINTFAGFKLVINDIPSHIPKQVPVEISSLVYDIYRIHLKCKSIKLQMHSLDVATVFLQLNSDACFDYYTRYWTQCLVVDEH